MITISKATPGQLGTVLDLVGRLLKELSDHPEEFAGLDLAAALPAIRDADPRFAAFLAMSDAGEPVGVATLTEAVAIYAGGVYGIISELYVAPGHRGTGVGPRLLEAVKAHGRGRGWRRVDVTAPPEPRWRPTVSFYERNGFVFTGPKLRCALGVTGTGDPADASAS
jgi:GNAT superfamily N-acetyltransferase